MPYLAVVCLLLTSLLGVAAADDAKPEEIVAKHLDSIGTAEARAAVKSRGIQGTLSFKILARGSASGDEAATGDATGMWGYISEQRKTNFVMKFGSAAWRGERFVFDGDKTNFAVFTSSHRPSSFGDFVRTQDFLLKEAGWAENFPPAGPSKTLIAAGASSTMLASRKSMATTCNASSISRRLTRTWPSNSISILRPIGM